MSYNDNPDTNGEFAGKVAIVTGATLDPSIGRSTATKLGLGGASVVINGRNNVTTSNSNVMPAFGLTEDVVSYLSSLRNR